MLILRQVWKLQTHAELLRKKKREKERKGTNTLYDSDDNRPPTQTRGQFKKRKRIICLIYPLQCLGLFSLWVELQRN